MNSRVLSLLFLFSFLGMICTPAWAISDKGRTLLDQLRGRVGKSSVTSGLASESEPALPVVVPTAQAEGNKEEKEQSEKKSSLSDSHRKKDAPEETAKPSPTMPASKDSQEAKSPEKDRTVEKQNSGELKNAGPEPKANIAAPPARSQTLPSQNGRMSTLIKSLKDKFDHENKDHSPGSQVKESGKPLPVKPEPAPADPIPVAVPEPAASKQAPEKTADAPAPAKGTDGHRSFADLSDEELIRYAEEHVWSSEKSKKHNPPPTPPYRPSKKSKKVVSDSSKSEKAKTKETTKTTSGKSKGKTSKKKTGS